MTTTANLDTTTAAVLALREHGERILRLRDDMVEAGLSRLTPINVHDEWDVAGFVRGSLAALEALVRERDEAREIAQRRGDAIHDDNATWIEAHDEICSGRRRVAEALRKMSGVAWDGKLDLGDFADKHVRPAVKETVQDTTALRAERDTLKAEVEQQRAILGTFDKRCADALADEVAVLVRRKVIDARSPAADALLDYREPPSSPRADRMAELERRLGELSAFTEELTWRAAEERGIDAALSEMEFCDPEERAERRERIMARLGVGGGR